jgi:very-short-patch-repair endonuclease
MDEQARHRVRPHMTARARSLRCDSTFPERLLWGMLRGGRLEGFKFRRQHVIGTYVADYCCAEANLVIELVGESHVGRGEMDHARTEYLQAQGYRVIRFTNDDVLQSPDAVATAILEALKKTD